MKKYPFYVDARLPWPQPIPRHWKLLRNKVFLLEREEKSTTGIETLLSLGQYAGVSIKGKNTEKTGMYKAESLIGYKAVYINDIVMNIMLAWNGSTAKSKYEGIISPAYAIYKMVNDTVNPDYLHYIFKTPQYMRYFETFSTGIIKSRLRLYPQSFLHLYTVIPPRPEQDQIVRFLDWKVSNINKLIAVRKREIEELEDLKRSQIGYLVMGQSKDIPQRETAISWVKAIPTHWGEKSLIQYAEEQQIKNVGMVENNLLSLSYGKIISKDINTTDGLLPASFEGYQIVHDGNIVLRLTDLQNDHKSLRTGLVTHTGIITSAYTCLKTRDGILPEYLQLQLHVADLCKVFYGMGGGVRQSIGFKDIRNLLIAIPPTDEQQRILELVHGVEEPINRTIQKSREITTTLEELKKRLIADVITGKIDVRDIEIPDFEYVEEAVDSSDEDDRDMGNMSEDEEE